MLIFEILDLKTRELSEVSPTPRLDADILFRFVSGFSRTDIIIKNRDAVSPEIEEKFSILIDKRKDGVPVAYITGEREFFEDTFVVNPNVLIPRPETEFLVEKAIRLGKESGKRSIAMLDLCTGSGCIGISVFKHLAGKITFADISTEALTVAEENFNRIIPGRIGDATFMKTDLFSEIDGNFDLITTNPPYISAPDMIDVRIGSTRFEPELALAGGESGFEIPEKIIRSAGLHLRTGGHLIMELGYDGAEKVEELSISDLDLIEFVSDLQGIRRHAVWVKKPKN